MSTWRIAREAGASRAVPARPAVSARRGDASEAPATSREAVRTTTRRRRARSPGPSAPRPVGVEKRRVSRARVALHRLVEDAAEALDLRLERVDAVEHLLDRLRQGIRQVGVLEIDAGSDALAITVDHLAGNTDHDGIRGHLGDHDRPRADPRALAHPQRAHDRGAGPDHDILLERGVPLLPLEARAPERHPLVQGHVVADLRGLADHHPHAVVDEDSGADARSGVDLDTR